MMHFPQYPGILRPHFVRPTFITGKVQPGETEAISGAVLRLEHWCKFDPFPVQL